MVIATRKGGGERGREAKEKKMEMERNFAWGGERMMQYADDVLLVCTLETCMVLSTTVTPINSI